jgi:hypothetical protein
MGEGESRDEAREKQSQDDKDDAENDHDDYLVSVQMFWERIAGSVPEGALQLGPYLLVVAWTARASVSGRVFAEPAARFFIA